ncbi:MAG: OsmC family protein [Bacteroidetes bacterium]|nr:MAG: OsmC family protein [Bacteroidota bacterium]
MSIQKINFKNSEGHLLAARLELPDNQKTVSYALFAHCFTCSKNLSAVRAISRALTSQGIAVLRFDFTGLGESEGDFEDTNFSSNVGDLIAGANYLEEHYRAPELLIGHSLGGAAVVFAARELESVRALVTIGAPSHPQHVRHLITSGEDEIREHGRAEVAIGGRPFYIRSQFLDDLETQKMSDVLKNLRKALLVVHSPQDDTVGIENAREIYNQAFHPKSFLSIDGADHLLSRKEDATYVGMVISGWASRYIQQPEKSQLTTGNQVVVSIGNEGFTTEMKVGKHKLLADEPEEVGGDDFGPSPYGYVTAGLGACTAMTLRMYADRKKWPLEGVTVHLDHGKDYCGDCEDPESAGKRIDHFVRYIELKGELSEEQQQKLLEIADKCPVHKTLHQTVQIKTYLK